MRDGCAPGHSRRLGTDSWVITYGGKAYRTLPKHDNIELGHVRKMIRHVGIHKDCARSHGVI
jgi:hypothetical protein